MTAVVLVAVELSVATGGGPGAAPLDAEAYLLGAVLVLPVLLRNRYPRFELLACSVLLLLYYVFDRRGMSPAPPPSAPLFDPAGGRVPRGGHRDPVRLHGDRPRRGGTLRALEPGQADQQFPARRRGAGPGDHAGRRGPEQAGAGRGDGGTAAGGARGTRGRGGP